MESKLEYFRKQLKELCAQTEKRIKEIGEMDIMTYRSDPVLKELRGKICELYRKAANICKTYEEATGICELFKEEPVCLTQLMLSEELVCPIPPKEDQEK